MNNKILIILLFSLFFHVFIFFFSSLLNFVYVILLLFGVFKITQGEILNCNFKDHTFSAGIFYTCKVTSLDNTNNNTVITGHNGSHVSNNNDKNVYAINIHNTKTKYIPQNLGLLFKLTVLWMYDSQLVEINAQNFKGMENLEQLSLNNNKLSSVPSNAFTFLTKLKTISLSQNQIEELPNDLFTLNINLEQIHLHSNNLKFVGSIVFEKLNQLNFVDILGNCCINKRYIRSTGIVQLKNDLKKQCLKPNQIPAIPTTTTPNPMVPQLNECIEEKSNLEKEVIELTQNLTLQNEYGNEMMKVKLELYNKDILNKELKANQQRSLKMFYRAKIDLDKLQDEYYDSTLKCLNDHFNQEMKFIALERQFNSSKCTTI